MLRKVREEGEKTRLRTCLPLPRSRLPIPIRRDRFSKPLIERALGPQEARHEKVKETPQFQDIVLDGRSREDKTMIRPKELDGLGELGLAVLDDVALVEDAIVPGEPLELGNVVSNNVVRHDDDIVLGDLAEKRSSLRRGTNVKQRLEVGRELEDFMVPMSGERRWTDNDGRQVNSIWG